MEYLTGAKISNWLKIRLMRVSVKRGVEVGVGAGFRVYLTFSFKECCFRVKGRADTNPNPNHSPEFY